MTFESKIYEELKFSVERPIECRQCGELLDGTPVIYPGGSVNSALVNFLMTPCTECRKKNQAKIKKNDPS